MIVVESGGSDGGGRPVESKSMRIVGMRNYLCLGNRANGDCFTASAPIWVSLSVNNQQAADKSSVSASEDQSEGTGHWSLGRYGRH